MRQFITLIALFFLSAAVHASPKSETQVVTLSVTENGFEPSRLEVKPGVPVTLKVTRTSDETCATQINFPAKKIKKDLPLNKEVSVNLGKLEKGEIRFACGMNMMEGKIITK